MLTAQATMSSKKQIARVSPAVSDDAQNLESLCERLLRQQPHAKALLERLLARSRRTRRQGVFAPIQDGRCSACNMRVASVRIQKARAGEFINCAHCVIFLYHD